MTAMAKPRWPHYQPSLTSLTAQAKRPAQPMFARRFRVTLRREESEKPVPKAWLDQFFMRNFTGYRAFDETLAMADGVIEASLAVSPEEMQLQFEKWLRGRRMIAGDVELVIAESEGERQKA
jgi:hypothetical protein